VTPPTKRPRGRPPKPPEERRSESIDTRVTAAEKADHARWAALDGFADVSAWYRWLAAKRGKALERERGRG
jgi:hypothetical protein